MPPKLKTEIVERSMFIFLPDRLLLLLNFSIPNKTFSLNVLFSAPCYAIKALFISDRKRVQILIFKRKKNASVKS